MPELAIAALAPATVQAKEALIRISDLRLRTFIGFNDEEKAKRQDIVINLELTYQLHEGILQDRVSAALDYKLVTKKIIAHVEEGRFLLLEKLASDVLGICASDARVSRASVSIDKPHALRFADSVSVTLEYTTESDEATERKAS